MARSISLNSTFNYDSYSLSALPSVHKYIFLHAHMWSNPFHVIFCLHKLWSPTDHKISKNWKDFWHFHASFYCNTCLNMNLTLHVITVKVTLWSRQWKFEYKTKKLKIWNEGDRLVKVYTVRNSWWCNIYECIKQLHLFIKRKLYRELDRYFLHHIRLYAHFWQCRGAGRGGSRSPNVKSHKIDKHSK